MAKFDPKPHIRKVIYTNKRTGEKTTVEILDTGPRLAWFRSEHPIDEGWQIITECLALDDGGAHYRARVINPEGKIIATGHRLVFKADFGNFNEKAETQAIGRALAAAGYGTLQAVEPEDGEEEPSQLPDTPVRTVPQTKPGENHWITSDEARKKFWAWAHESLGLTDDEVHQALNVKSVKGYPGSMKEAKKAIEEWLAAQMEDPELAED